MFRRSNDFDDLQDYSEQLTLTNFENYNLVHVTAFEPWMFGAGWYMIFTLLLCVEFYKIYIDHYCSVQKFSVKKLVSTW